MRDGRRAARGIRLSQAVNVEDVRTIAVRRLPTAVKDFIEGGAEDEVTLDRNRAAFRGIELRHRVLSNAGERSQRTTLLGTPVESPIVLSPVGLAALAHPTGERAAAIAAAKQGLISTLSSSSCWSIEDVAEVTPVAPKWFQLYIWRDREITREVVERARSAGYTALAVTVDVPVAARRERDIRNGFEIPPRPTVRHLGDVLRHVGWFSRMAKDEAFGHGLTMGNFAKSAGIGERVVMMQYVNKMFDPTVTWDDMAWLKEIWGGPLIIKGVTNENDAREAVSRGADAVWVSNHGGRQLDGLPATIDVLPAVVEAVDGRAEVYLDSGVRRGSDVVKALALGARACMIGRAWMYGLAAGGEDGITRVIEILRAEIDATLALLGCASIEDLDPSWLRPA